MNSIILSSEAIVVGLIVLMLSADLFVKGSVAIANQLGVPTLLIGVVVVGFGTSAPELIVSAISALNGNPDIALGNAFGSNIFNIAPILGITAIISPIIVPSSVLKRELPILIFITLLSIYLLRDLNISRLDAIIMLAVFFVVMSWMIWSDWRHQAEVPLGQDELDIKNNTMSLPKGILCTIIGLGLLIMSSDLLVKNAAHIAKLFGVSDLVIGLTIIAIGTSLPELASSIVAAKKGETSLALGNIIGSNIFNTLAVVGLAGAIHQPFKVPPEVMVRDIPLISALTLILYIFSVNFVSHNKLGGISRLKGMLLLSSYIVYTCWLLC